jgi:hypothetical protein
MIRFIILFVVAYLAYRALKSWMFPKTGGSDRVDRAPAGEIDDVMVKDPYCGAYFPSRDGIRYTIDGQELSFCSEACRKKYIAEHSRSTSDD